jgi:SAM-dependent methyltransferase
MRQGDSYALRPHADGWLTVEPKPDAVALKAFYAEAYYQESHGVYAPSYTAAELQHRDLLARLLLHALEEARTSHAGERLLEIGCGEGFFLQAALAAGFDARGLEFSDHGLKQFHPNLAPRVQFGDAFESLDRLIHQGIGVDVCVMEHVLEHVADPEGLLARLPAILRPGGVVAITVPNDFSPVQLEAQAQGHIERAFWVNVPQHLNYFNHENLPRLLQRLGFAVTGGYASFPIDWFLFHPGSNYVRDPAAGKAAHQARLSLDLLMAEHSLKAFYRMGQAYLECGVGRSITLIARPWAG